MLYNFGDVANDGGHSYSGLTFVGGALYGTAESGGPTNNGTVFKFASNTETTVYAFRGLNANDGVGPNAGVIEVKGALYGVTSEGGKTNNGILYKIVGNSEKIVHDFATANSNDGREPWSDLIDVKGYLYGTTVIGGTEGDGSVFEQKL